MDHIDVVDALLRDRPRFHAGGEQNWNALPESLRALQTHVVQGARTLETGCGASTVVFAAQGANHTVISPDAREHERVQAYCRGLGVDVSRISFVDGFSDNVLPSLLEGRELDFAFIDGAHSFPYPVVDWHYISRSLKVGGGILVDDIPIPAVASLFRFMEREANWRLDGIFDDRTALFSLVELPPPEDYVLQAYNRRLDYSFASRPSRIRMSATDHVAAWRHTASARFPRLHRCWKSVSRTVRS